MPADRAVELEAMSIDAIIHSLIAHSPNLGQVVDAVRELNRRIDAARNEGRREGLQSAASMLRNEAERCYGQLAADGFNALADRILAAPTPVEESA